MDLRALRYVVAVAERLSFTAASRELHVSQPALSQHIRQFEEELGVQLFARTSHRVTLTSAGALVVEHAKRTLDSATRLREAVDAHRGLTRGKLRLAVTQSFNALHLPGVLAEFLTAHPGIDVTALEWTNAAVIAGVADGALDLGVAFGPVEAAVTAQRLYDDRLMLACSATHRLASSQTVQLRAVMEETLALLTVDFGTRRALDRFFEAEGVRPQRIVELDTFTGILKLVEGSSCITVMPVWSANIGGSSDPVVFRPLEPSPPARTINLLLPPNPARSPAASAFAELLRARDW